MSENIESLLQPRRTVISFWPFLMWILPLVAVYTLGHFGLERLCGRTFQTPIRSKQPIRTAWVFLTRTKGPQNLRPQKIPIYLPAPKERCHGTAGRRNGHPRVATYWCDDRDASSGFVDPFSEETRRLFQHRVQ